MHSICSLSFPFQKPGKKEAKKDPSASKAPAKKKSREGADDGSKKKKQKKKKDPNAPKRAISGFMFFSKMEREVIYSRNLPLPNCCWVFAIVGLF